MKSISIMLILAFQLWFCIVGISHGQSIVPGFMIFGDSVVDTGNNNNQLTLVKANFRPYGRDFGSHLPTGRFCNGKLATDFTVETLGFSSYPPAYFSSEAQGENLLYGANFALAASGYWDKTAILYGAVPLTRQLRNFEEYQARIKAIAGEENATELIRESIYLLSAGSSDYVQNYYINPLINKLKTPDQVTSLAPLGCLPASITLFGKDKNDCVTRLNSDAIGFNYKLKAAAEALKKSHPDLKLVVFDIYNPLLDLVQNPSKYGFFETRKACCGTGTIETSLLCNAISIGTCSDASGYVFWDSFHPSEAANKALAGALLLQGIELIS
ncbi:GDSL esterase/lipase [Carex littledalei]|uniref:GDSL esterase/lipase n=1 Tax=Carex littledalei TaxID=544730 RepID=A0A833R4C7_9POAL|nr:GDSL esterase/lipase [Carex littledalei]